MKKRIIFTLLFLLVIYSFHGVRPASATYNLIDCDLFEDSPGRMGGSGSSVLDTTLTNYLTEDPIRLTRRGCQDRITLMPSTTQAVVSTTSPVVYRLSRAVTLGVRPARVGVASQNTYGVTIQRCHPQQTRVVDSMSSRREMDFCPMGSAEMVPVVPVVIDASGLGPCPIKVHEGARLSIQNLTIYADDPSRVICKDTRNEMGVYESLPSNVLLPGIDRMSWYVPGNYMPMQTASTATSPNEYAWIYRVNYTRNPAMMGMAGMSGMDGMAGMAGNPANPEETTCTLTRSDAQMDGSYRLTWAFTNGSLASVSSLEDGELTLMEGATSVDVRPPQATLYILRVTGHPHCTASVVVPGTAPHYDDPLICEDMSLSANGATLEARVSGLPVSPNEAMGAIYNPRARNLIQIFRGECGTGEDLSGTLRYTRSRTALTGRLEFMPPIDRTMDISFCLVARRDDTVACRIPYSVRTQQESASNQPTGSFTFQYDDTNRNRVTLQWTAANGRAYLSGGGLNGAQQINGTSNMGSVTDTIYVPTHYVLTVRGMDGRDYIYEATTRDPQTSTPTIDFSYASNSAGPGFSLRWTIQNATSRTLAGPSISAPESIEAVSISRVVTEEGLYTITATGILSTVRRTLNVSRNALPGGEVAPAPECRLTRTETAGGASFTWTTSNATAVAFKKDGDAANLSANANQTEAIVIRNPVSGMSSYTLSATGGNGQSCSVTAMLVARRLVATRENPDPDGDHICNIRLDPAPATSVCRYGPNGAIDNCNDAPNEDQANADGDFAGDACETSANATVFNHPNALDAASGGCSCQLNDASSGTFADTLPLFWLVLSGVFLRTLRSFGKRLATKSGE